MNNLRPHQVESVTKALNVFKSGGKAFLMGDSVGLGKSRAALAVAKEFSGCKMLIVAPLSTFCGWKREAETMGVEIREYSKVTGMPGDYSVLINYEKLDKIENEEFSFIIWDECHKNRSTKTKRWKIFSKLYSKARHNLLMSATPGQSPLDLAYLKDVIGFKSFWPWVRSFKGVVPNRWGGMEFRPGSSDDARRLSKIIEGNPRAIRHTPEQIEGWPELQREIFPIQLTPEQGEFYNQAFADYLQARQEAGLNSLHPEAYDMIAVGQFRKRISELRVDATVDLADTLISQNKVVTIACEYVQPAKKIYQALSDKGWKVDLICGETSRQDREDILMQSAQDYYHAIVFTVNEGINLHQVKDEHRERVQIAHDLQWSALDQTQIEGRTHRAGRFALNYWMVVADTVDERCAKVLQKRMKTLGTITGDRINPDDYLYGYPVTESNKQKELAL